MFQFFRPKRTNVATTEVVLFAAKILDSIEKRVAFQFKHVSKFNKMVAAFIPNAVLLSQFRQIVEGDAEIPQKLRTRIQNLASKLETFHPKLLTQVLKGIDKDLLITGEFRKDSKLA